jgi:hypothetical protein
LEAAAVSGEKASSITLASKACYNDGGGVTTRELAADTTSRAQLQRHKINAYKK